MFESTRRSFLRQTGIGLATIGVSGLTLRSDALPTQVVSEEQSKNILIKMGPTPKDMVMAKELKKLRHCHMDSFIEKERRSEES